MLLRRRRRIVFSRRTEYNNWDLISVREARHHDNGHLRIFWKAAARNIDRARGRWQGSQISSIPDDVGPLAPADATALQISSGGGMVPDLPPVTLFFLRLSGFVESPSESRPDSGLGRPATNVQTPQRSAEQLGAGSPQGRRTESLGGLSRRG